MGMSEAEFFGQSIIHWRRRISGFMELHGSGQPSAETPMTSAELEAWMEANPDAPPQSAEASAAAML